MTDDQRLHWQIAGAIYTHVTNGLYGDPQAAMQRAVKDAEMLRLMVVGDWNGGEPVPIGAAFFCYTCKGSHKPGMPCEGRT